MPKPAVAIVGASADRSKFGNKSIRAHLAQGFDVYPVNPKGGVIEGLPAYTSLAAIPAAHLNRISLYVPPKIGLAMIPEIKARGCDELWLNPGADSDDLIAAARAAGLNTIVACSIVALGVSPGNFSDE